MSHLPKNVTSLRQKAGISQSELARKMGVSPPRISDIESGSSNPTLSTIQAIADVLCTTPSRLLAGPAAAKSK